MGKEQDQVEGEDHTKGSLSPASDASAAPATAAASLLFGDEASEKKMTRKEKKKIVYKERKKLKKESKKIKRRTRRTKRRTKKKRTRRRRSILKCMEKRRSITNAST